MAYLGEFGGPIADKRGATLRAATVADINSVFNEIDDNHSGFLNKEELGQAAAKLGFAFKSVGGTCIHMHAYVRTHTHT